MKTELKSLLCEAKERGYAVPAFNCSDCWQLKGIVKAAEAERSPVIVQTIPTVLATWPVEAIGQMGMYLAQNAKVPVIFHLDHAENYEFCFEAIQAGYTSVMIDGSALPIEENAAVCRKVAAIKKGQVSVEGEVGRIRGQNSEGCYMGSNFLADVEEAVYLAEHGSIDSLAVGIGNAHGVYTTPPELNFKRLLEIREAVSLPLVLHGGSGIPNELVQEAIRCGISKVNIGTQLQQAYVASLQKRLISNPQPSSVIDAMESAAEGVYEQARELIRMCLSNGTV